MVCHMRVPVCTYSCREKKSVSCCQTASYGLRAKWLTLITALHSLLLLVDSRACQSLTDHLTAAGVAAHVQYTHVKSLFHTLDLDRGISRTCLIAVLCPCRVDCCLYAVNMGYHSSVGNSTAAVTTDNTTAIAISCPTTTPVRWQTADLTVTTTASPGAGTVATVHDVTNPGGNDTTYVAKVVLEPSYQVVLKPGSGMVLPFLPSRLHLPSLSDPCI